MHQVLGKSTSYIIPNALKIANQEKEYVRKELETLAIQGKNVVCTDPKGELFGVTSKIFEKEGYDVVCDTRLAECFDLSPEELKGMEEEQRKQHLKQEEKRIVL